MEEREREKAREKEREKAREKTRGAMTRRVVMVSGVSQPTLALGRLTSNCHAGQDKLICLELLPVLSDRLLQERLVYLGS